MSETSIQLKSQRSLPGANTSLDSNGSRIQPMGMTQAQKHARIKPKFVEFACSHTEIYRYVVLITNTIIPSAFWGSSRNLKVIFACTILLSSILLGF
ncbi:hypothetical protein CPB83DRAFT_756862 [Crepidotus variabilis]|uniref:Uncharacterized protein n=1 Tax=Crepidotus variabilis TaxID=179855 RepID=A0A9P6ERE3_9AGAR|nr:hypothetical protein CPB83DRAFT_756862 [Crepidotus variabilis]